MNVLIAPDSFKNALPALDAANCIKTGLLRSLPGAEIRIVPMADGGEGTVESLIDATGGRKVARIVRGPFSRDVEATFGITGDGETAVIEMAAASGIQLISAEERDPMLASTFGTGELIRAALEEGCRTILLGIGGSATNDGGKGMAHALGIRFLDDAGEEVPEGGGSLHKVRKIDMGSLDPRIHDTRILVACDVTNPLTGKHGASHVYGPQKGASPEMVKLLDENLAFLARIINEQLGKDVENVPGAGAAGGLGAGLIAFLGGELIEGVTAIGEQVGLEEQIQWADLVITGEGGMDKQTLYGKTPYGVAQIAKRNGKKVIALAGSLGEGAEILYDHGISAMMSILNRPMLLEEAIAETPRLLEAAGERIGRLISISGK